MQISEQNVFLCGLDKMIQRIQSLYLILVAILTGLMFMMPVSIHKIKNPGGEILLLNNMFDISDKENLIGTLNIWPVTLLAFGVILVSLAGIFLFKNRSLQIKIVRLLSLLLTGLVVLLYVFSDFKVQTLAAGNPYSTVFLLGSYAPLVSLFLVYLSIKAIKKDDDLVRSADRLR